MKHMEALENCAARSCSRSPSLRLLLAIVSGQVSAQTMREVIGPGDTIRITAYRNPDLTTEARLYEGKLNAPLGRDEPKGAYPDQAAKRIADRLKSGKYLLDPQITVTVVQARSRLVSILGFVNSPGRYELDGISAKISDVIAMAGGLDPNASDKIILQPSGAGKSEPVIVDLSSIIQGDSSKNIEVRGGDSIFVPRASVVYVYGEVQKGRTASSPTWSCRHFPAHHAARQREPVQIRRKEATEMDAIQRWVTDVVSPDDVIYVREGLF
jgi:polysaccharide export outer membrane protein